MSCVLFYLLSAHMYVSLCVFPGASLWFVHLSACLTPKPQFSHLYSGDAQSLAVVFLVILYSHLRPKH